VQNNLGALPVKSVGSPDKTLRASRAFFDAGYEFDFSEKWKGQLNATYNGFSEGYLVGASTFNAYSNDFILEFDNKITANEKANILFGGVGYYHSGGGYEQGVNNVPLYSQMWWSLYAQGDFKVKERLKLIAGVQANKPQDVDIDFVPRLGAVFHVNKKFGFKALYAQAFRSAFALERSLIAPGVLRGNPNLKPEKVGTLDLQAFWYSEKFQFSVNYFRSKMTDIITRVAVPNSPENTYINAGVLSISGVEAEVKASLSSNFFFIGSLSLNKNVLNDTIKNATHMPESAYKFGVAYTLGGVFNAGVFASSFADFGDVANVRPSRLNVNPVAKGFTYVTANVSVDVFRAMKVKSAQSLLLFCYVNNLLDSEIYYPEFSRRRINSIPGRPGRAFHFGLKFKF
jgi:outer membrane receptor protein involved in Fe transport